MWSFKSNSSVRKAKSTDDANVAVSQLLISLLETPFPQSNYSNGFVAKPHNFNLAQQNVLAKANAELRRFHLAIMHFC